MPNKKWVCKTCGNETGYGEKVCMVCKTKDTQIRGYVDKKKIE
ncbi:MAG: hypothetical protein ABIH11_08650 [Candidatus Altiarchaeota archaeon]